MRKNRKVVLMTGTIVLALVLAVGISVIAYNNSTPVRMNRQLDLGYKYLTEQNYEQAIVAFQTAIEIEPMSAEAYLGMAEAYTQLGDNEKVIEVLKQGYAAAGEKEEIKGKLMEVYLEAAKIYVDSADYKKALEYYDAFLELDGENTKLLSDLENCLIKYIDFLMEEGQYEEIRHLQEKYGDITHGVDFQTYITKIEEIERIVAENKAFMQKVYDLMEVKDYDGLQELNESEELQEFLHRMENECFIYIPESGERVTGTGAAIYCLDESSYYFFYGEYVEGIRSGKGTTFNVNSFGGYTDFTGEWKDDAPNGQGELFFQRYMGGDGEPYQEIFSGNFVNGLCDGAMTNTTIMGGLTYDMSCNVTMGVPEDRTAELLVHIPYATQMIAEDAYIYAFDNPQGKWFFATIHEGMTMGVIGFRTE